MTTLEVIDISDNNTVAVEENPTEAKPKAKAKTRAKKEVKEILEEVVEENNEEKEPEVKPKAKAKSKAKTKEIIEVIEEVKEEVKEVIKEEEVKPSYRNSLKEKTSCPDCGKELTMHGLRYTHKKYCKAKQNTSETEVKIDTQPCPSGCQEPKQPEQVADTMPRVGIKDAIPTNQQIADFLSNQRKTRHIVKREQMSSLIKKALPQ
jgi:hypothetical protein